MTLVSRIPAATQIGPKDGFVTVNGLRLHYLDWGMNGSEALVALHGVGGQGHTWDSFAGAVRTLYHVYALDQRGFGDSDHDPAANYSTTAFANDLLGFLDALGLQKVVLVGHSMGGHNAMAFAARHPERVSKLVVVDLAPGPRSGAGGAQQTEFDSLEELVQANAAANPRTPIEQIRLLAETNTKVLPNGKTGFKRDPRLPAAWQAEDLWDEVTRITAPVLVTRGSITRAFTREDAERMTRVIPNCTLVEFEGAGHGIHNDQPSEFTAAVLKFLRG